MLRFAVVLLALAMVCGIYNANPIKTEWNDCPGINQVWTNCSNICPPTCFNHNRFCSLRCGEPRCQCKPDYVLDGNGTCVDVHSCPKRRSRPRFYIRDSVQDN